MEPHTKPTKHRLRQILKNHLLFPARKSQEGLNTRFHAGVDVLPVTPCNFSPEIIYLSKRLDGRFPLGPVNLSWLIFTVPWNQQGNQVRIYNKSFGEFIGAILAKVK